MKYAGPVISLERNIKAERNAVLPAREIFNGFEAVRIFLLNPTRIFFLNIV